MSKTNLPTNWAYNLLLTGKFAKFDIDEILLLVKKRLVFETKILVFKVTAPSHCSYGPQPGKDQGRHIAVLYIRYMTLWRRNTVSKHLVGIVNVCHVGKGNAIDSLDKEAISQKYEDERD